MTYWAIASLPAGFIDHLCKQLAIRQQEIKMPDIEDIVRQYNGQVNAYPEVTTGRYSSQSISLHGTLC